MFILVFAGASCRNSGIPGGGFLDKNVNVRIDTLAVTDIKIESHNPINGWLSPLTGTRNARYTSFGKVNDPVFGQIEATALVRPTMISLPDSQTIGLTAQAFLRFRFQELAGDTTAAASVEMVEITRLWRGNSWRADSSISTNLGRSITTFTYQGEDSLDIAMPDWWLRAYIKVAQTPVDTRDSVFDATIQGFILRAPASNRLISVDMTTSLLYIDRIITEADSSLHWKIPMRTWAYSMNESGAAIPAGTAILDNRWNHTISFDFPIEADTFQTANLLRAELVLYEASSALESGLPAGFVRPKPAFFEVYAFSDLDFVYESYNTAPQFVGTRDSTESGYRANIAVALNSRLQARTHDGRRLYASLHSGSSSGAPKGFDGSIFQTLINLTADPARAPKLIITRIPKP